ncbi:MAG TPA: type II secretion system protein [Candidatus Ozemobacteraceae bacterium]|nr:type II secretion system protein [Candidatus Ozemobacteraceae bacterium]
MPRGDLRGKGERRGVALLSLTVVLLILGFSLSLILPRANNEARRAKEDELRFALGEFRRAAERFAAANGRQPLTLDELCRDGEGRRFLRRIYRDPMTGNADWTVLSRDGLFEVRSSSRGTSVGGIPYERFK